jgi:hypothetical protein
MTTAAIKLESRHEWKVWFRYAGLQAIVQGAFILAKNDARERCVMRSCHQYSLRAAIPSAFRLEMHVQRGCRSAKLLHFAVIQLRCDHSVEIHADESRSANAERECGRQIGKSSKALKPNSMKGTISSPNQ